MLRKATKILSFVTMEKPQMPLKHHSEKLIQPPYKRSLEISLSKSSNKRLQKLIKRKLHRLPKNLSKSKQLSKKVLSLPQDDASSSKQRNRPSFLTNRQIWT